MTDSLVCPDGASVHTARHLLSFINGDTCRCRGLSYTRRTHLVCTGDAYHHIPGGWFYRAADFQTPLYQRKTS